ncbi:hypothetical protein N9N40_05635 [Planktomarina temperata]|nr:hypothetical protein [Planktomarina temperata]
MSDPKPDRILAEESDNPWVKLILWAHEDSVRGTERWNGFIKYLVEERLDTDSAAFKSALPLSGEALEHAKNFFRIMLILRKISSLSRLKTIFSVRN